MTAPRPPATNPAPRESLLSLPPTGPPKNPPLEDLPSELRHQILSTLELEGLSALVHASPTFHQQYLEGRRAILYECLRNTLRSVTPDAFAVYRTSSLDFSKTRTTDSVIHFLRAYCADRPTHGSIRNESLTEDDVLAMVAFHNSIVLPLARRYSHWALTNLAQESRKQASASYSSLSNTEKLRIFRAMYRLQLASNLFGRSQESKYDPPGVQFNNQTILRKFIWLCKPWEIEEISCFLEFANAKYEDIFKVLGWNVTAEDPIFNGERPPSPPVLARAFIHERQYLRSGLISRGLSLMHLVMVNQDHGQLATTMRQQTVWRPFLNEAFNKRSQDTRRRVHPIRRDQRQNRRKPMRFKGDVDGAPPLAWIQIWRGTYSNLYGEYIDPSIQRWGYVFWDATRLERSRGTHLLAQQRKAWLSSGDPRESM